MTTITSDRLLFRTLGKEDVSVGNIKLGFINTNHQSAQSSLLVGEKSCWGKGYATEAISTVTEAQQDQVVAALREATGI